MKKTKKTRVTSKNKTTYKSIIKDCNIKSVNKRKLTSLALVPMIICGSIIGTATNVKASQMEDSYYSDMIYVDEDTNKLSYQADESEKNNKLLFIDSEFDNNLTFDEIAFGVSCIALGVAVADYMQEKNKRR